MTCPDVAPAPPQPSPVTFCDESPWGFGWIAAEPPWLERTSHALLAGDGVWLIDPVDFPGLDERVRALGRPAGVIQLLDRHGRDSAPISARLGVPIWIVPPAIPGSPFQVVELRRSRHWQEVALWWPERRVLVAADAVGTVRYYCAPGERLGVHPLLRARPPRPLARFEPQAVLVGHGAGIHDDATAALRDAVAHARRNALRLLPRLVTFRRH